MTTFSMATLRLVLPMPERQLHFRIRQEDGSLWATVDEYPGVFATGDDLEELRASLEEGIRFMKADAGGPLPDVRLLPLYLSGRDLSERRTRFGVLADFVAVAVGVPDEGWAEGQVAFAEEAALLGVDAGGVAVF